MPDLRETRRKIKIALIAMLGVDLVAIVILVSPLVGSSQSRRAELDQLWQELQSKTRQVEPLRGMDKKVALAQQQINDFYKDRLPAQDSSISDQLGKVAAENGVKIAQVRYKAEDPVDVGLRPVTIEAELSGDYLQLVRFLNALEREKIFFVVDSVTLGSEQSGPVKLGVKLETYLKTGA
jgi:Tfp pilus assembly protein PilO